MRFLFLLLCTIVIIPSCKKAGGEITAESIIDSTILVESIKYEIDTIPLDYLLGKYNPKKDDRFEVIPKKYTLKDSIFLRKETMSAFKQMYDSAYAQGIKLSIKSATRNFDYQNRIWLRKWKQYKKQGLSDIDAAKRILTYSAMPCTSRHHWGTDIDINMLDNNYFEKGLGLREYTWLKENASKFGFCQTYTKKDSLRPTGYNEEKWHWSYLPLANELTNAYERQVTPDLIKGFKGASFSDSLNIIQEYVLGINHECKHN